MPRRDRTLLGAVLVLSAATLWGTLGLFARVLADAGISPLQMTSVRTSCTAVGIGAWLALRRPERLRIQGRDLGFFLAYGIFGLALFHYLYFETLEYTSIAVAVALLYTAPAFVVITSRLTLGEEIGRVGGVALGLVLLGIFLVTGALQIIVTGEAAVTRGAVILGLGSGVSYGLYTIFGKRAVGRYDSYQTVFYSFLFGAIAISILAPPWIPFRENPEAIIPLVSLGVIPTILPYLLYITALRYLTSSTASMLASLEPVVATVLGFILLSEVMTISQGVGIAAIVIAALLLAHGGTRAPVGDRLPE